MKEVIEGMIEKGDSNNIKKGKVEQIILDNNGNAIGYDVRVEGVIRKIYTTSFPTIKEDDFLMIYTPKNIIQLGQILGHFKTIVEIGQTTISMGDG